MTTDPAAQLRAWVDQQVDAGGKALELVGVLAGGAARSQGLPIDHTAPQLVRQAPRSIELPEIPEIDAWMLGGAYEYALEPAHRRSQGVHYTPRSVACGLVALALDDEPDQLVCDPAVGGGVFLLAAAEHLEALGQPPDIVVAEQLWGIDIDPDAARVAELAIVLWGSRDGRWLDARPHIVVADTLVDGVDGFIDLPHKFDAVVGNPPFQGQLQISTARTPERNRALRARWDVATGPYADTAVFFLLAAMELAGPNATVALVQPQSVLVAADASAARSRLDEMATLDGLWIGDAKIFEADVHVCAPVLRRGVAPGPTVDRWTGPKVVAAKPAKRPPGDAWGSLLAELRGVPDLGSPGARSVGDFCSATAGFRDQFYGLAPHTYESPSGIDPALVTVGMLDPLRNRWGTGEFRYAGNRWTFPRVDLQSLGVSDEVLRRWVDQRLEPKLLVATQTKVLEVFVDEEGELVPSTPVIAVVPPIERLWHMAAALSSPSVTAVAYSRVVGAALSAETIKLSARQLLELPLPIDEAAWDDGARQAEVVAMADADSWPAEMLKLGEIMCTAYAVTDPDELMQWWGPRLPPWR